MIFDKDYVQYCEFEEAGGQIMPVKKPKLFNSQVMVPF
jgi:hypothetical protein